MEPIQIEKISREEARENCHYCQDREVHMHWYVVREEDNKLNAHTLSCFDLVDDEVTDILNDEKNFQGFIKVKNEKTI
jgi:hypothetical protein